MVTITNQVYVFINCIIGGLIIGLLFDAFKLTRKYLNTRDMITYIEDILFWILVGIIVLVTIFYSNNGQLRGYVFLGMALGTVFYFLVFSRIIIKILSNVIEILIKLVKHIIKIVSIPIKITVRILKIPLRLIGKRAVLLGKILVKLLKHTKEQVSSAIRAKKIINKKT